MKTNNGIVETARRIREKILGYADDVTIAGILEAEFLRWSTAPEVPEASTGFERAQAALEVIEGGKPKPSLGAAGEEWTLQKVINIMGNRGSHYDGYQKIADEINLSLSQLLEQNAAIVGKALIVAGLLDLDASATVEQVIEKVSQLREELEKIKTEEVRRIRHLNRLGTWAQQDPTGPLVAGNIQQFVLRELEAALGSEYKPSAWQPDYFKLQEQNADLRERIKELESKAVPSHEDCTC